MVIVGLMVIASCSDDEKPKVTLGFEEAESEALENDGTIDITITLDKPASETVVLAYTLGGTADKLTSDGGDFDIVPDGGVIVIEKGDSEATIEIEVLEDGELEYDFNTDVGYETVELTITEVIAGPAQLGEENLTHTLYIFEDDMLVILDWEQSGGEVVEDMDLFLWYDNPEDSPDGGFRIVDESTTVGGELEAILLIGGYPNAEYGFSYVYYEGDADDLEFNVTFINFGGSINGGAFGEGVQFTGNYSLLNINPWETATDVQRIVQTAEKLALNYTISSLVEPDEGSRQKLLFGNFGDVDRTSLKGSARKISLPPGFLEKFKK